MTTPDRPIVWLASYPKSGNTWVRIFLEAWFCEGPVRTDRALLRSHNRDYYVWQNICPRAIGDTSDLEIAHLWPAYYTHMAATKLKVQLGDKRRLLMKTHHMVTSQEGVPLIPPGLTNRAIYIVRDPRDVALSLANHTGQSIVATIEFMNAHKATLSAETGKRDPFADVCGSWSLNVKTWTDKSGGPQFPVHVVRYEDLLDDPVGEFKNILQFINAWDDDDEYAPGRLERAVSMSSFENLRQREVNSGFVYRPPSCKQFFHTGRSHWQEDLRPGFARRLVDEHKEQMRQWGYLDAAL